MEKSKIFSHKLCDITQLWNEHFKWRQSFLILIMLYRCPHCVFDDIVNDILQMNLDVHHLDFFTLSLRLAIPTQQFNFNTTLEICWAIGFVKLSQLISGKSLGYSNSETETIWQSQCRHIHLEPVSPLSMVVDNVLFWYFPLLSSRRACGNNVVDLKRLKTSSRLSIGLILKGGWVLHWNHHRLIAQFKNETDLQCWWHSTFAAVRLIRNLSKK